MPTCAHVLARDQGVLGRCGASPTIHHPLNSPPLQIESEFGLTCYPVVWPIGDGPRFQGVLERYVRGLARLPAPPPPPARPRAPFLTLRATGSETQLVHLFERGDRKGKAAALETVSIDDPALEEMIGEVCAFTA